jgi:hypothetical protein
MTRYYLLLINGEMHYQMTGPWEFRNISGPPARPLPPALALYLARLDYLHEGFSFNLDKNEGLPVNICPF